MLTPANHDASSPVSPSGESLRAAFAEAAHRGREATAILAPADLAAARDHLDHGWPGVAAAALLAPAWSLPEAPPLADVPDAHWGDYMDWLLAIPANPPPEFVSALARHLARRTAELADWMERNLAAPPVRAAADAYFRTACPPLALLPTELLLPLQQARASVFTLPTGALAWQMAAAGDFNADGKTDLVYQNTSTGERCIWLMNGTARLSVVNLPTGTTAWRIAAAGDLNADGKPDIVFENTADGRRSLWLMNGTARTATVDLPAVDAAWRISNH